MKRVCLSVLAMALAGCGGTGADLPREDSVYTGAMDAGRSAFDLAHPDQAQAQYENAYRRALMRDDATALGDAGYNLAVTILARGQAEKALDTVSRTRADLALRGHADVASLSAVQAAALYRLGRYPEALQVAQAIRSTEPDLAERAAYLGGIAGDASGRADILSSSLARIRVKKGASRLWQADRAELSARLALRQGQGGVAVQEALRAVDLRRDLLDYRGMEQALDLAARGASLAGDETSSRAYAEQARESRKQDEAAAKP